MGKIARGGSVGKEPIRFVQPHSTMWKSIYTPPGSPPSLEEMDAQQEHTPVETLRIRTPDFSTHEEAERLYIKKRMDRAETRRQWKRVYTGSVVAACWIGGRALLSHSSAPLRADTAILITLGSVAFTVVSMAAYSFCKGVMDRHAGPEPPATHEKSDYDAEAADWRLVAGAHV